MTFDFRAARLTMVESQVRTSDVTDFAITDAMRQVPREAFCGVDKAPLAYADSEIEYAPGRWLMRPREIGKLLQVVGARPGERALAIAAPYAAALLEEMGLTVVEAAADEPQAPLDGDFDVIVSEGAVAQVPDSWFAALAEGGRLGVVLRDGPVGKAWLFTRQDGNLAGRDVFDATPPYLPGFSPRPQFAF